MTSSILVVEDYPDLRDAIAEVLSRNDCVCDCVGSEGAIAKLRTTQYAAILLASRLSIKGDPVLTYLAQYQPAELAHVVLMSDPLNADDMPDARCHVLTKPFGRDELLAQIAAAQ